MSSSGNSQPNNETPILHIDTTTFQAAVSAVVTTVLAHLNSVNVNKTDNGVDNSHRGSDPMNQQIVEVANTENNNSIRVQET